jgi:large subunit ribosomal protein L34e
MVVRGAVTVSSRGAFMCFVRIYYRCLKHASSILRAFLVEEAKIVKKVIKSQEKAGGRK